MLGTWEDTKIQTLLSTLHRQVRRQRRHRSTAASGCRMCYMHRTKVSVQWWFKGETNFQMEWPLNCKASFWKEPWMGSRRPVFPSFTVSQSSDLGQSCSPLWPSACTQGIVFQLSLLVCWNSVVQDSFLHYSVYIIGIPIEKKEKCSTALKSLQLEMYLWARYLIFLNLHFLTCKMGIITVLTLRRLL